MSKRGFVYVLGNEYMPDVHKVGCTERAPHERASELSNHTGVPAPFSVLCYIEVEDFQAVEKEIHEWMTAFRISSAREFFHFGIRGIVRYMWHHPRRLAFCDATVDRGGVSQLVDLCEVTELFELPDPWAPKPPPPEVEEEEVADSVAAEPAPPVLALVGGADERAA